MAQSLTSERIFGDTAIAWGKKHPLDSKLVELWEKDRDYLIWAANLNPKRPCDFPMPAEQTSLVRIAHLLTSGNEEEAKRLLKSFQQWKELTQQGLGLGNLPRPSRAQCMKTLQSCTLLGCHWDLDGMYSAAIAICLGGALEGGKIRGAFGRLRLFRYGFRSLDEYTEALGAGKDETTVIIDYAAHPQAALTLDHHMTSLSYWELGAPIPPGIYEPSMPSCPRLLATYCGLEVSEEILCGCDLVDGALYADVAQASDLSHPFVALEYALSVDVSEPVAKKVILTLAENQLDPQSILSQAVWKARLALVALELEEQRGFWQKESRFRHLSDLLSVADARLAPHSATRFRYLPFENSDVIQRAYLVTIRPQSTNRVNLGISRNPFYHDADFFYCNPLNLGALAKQLGRGGGRMEASAVTIETAHLSKTLESIEIAVTASISQSE